MQYVYNFVLFPFDATSPISWIDMINLLFSCCMVTKINLSIPIFIILMFLIYVVDRIIDSICLFFNWCL